MESDPRYCGELADVMALNNLNYSLQCAKASSDGLAQWILEHDHVDLVDIDVQGAERDLFKDPVLLQAMARKVYRIVVGTHSPEIHHEISSSFRFWLRIYDLPYAPDTRHFWKVIAKSRISSRSEERKLSCKQKSQNGSGQALHQSALARGPPRNGRGHPEVAPDIGARLLQLESLGPHSKLGWGADF